MDRGVSGPVPAALARGYGPPDVVEPGEIVEPEAGPGKVLVRVRAASMNPLDVKLRSGDLRPFLRLKFPAVLGFDLAGEVAEVGEGVDGFAPGERVYGRTDARTGGTHAARAAVAADVIDRIPPGLSFEDAASLPLVAMTAVQALEKVGLGAGDRLLVNGAAGGVGTAAVQIGLALGAEVTGVCSAVSAPLVEELGALVLDYTNDELARTAERFDVVFDTLLNRPVGDLTRVLEPRGRYVTTGFSAGFALRMAMSLLSRRRFTFVVSRADGALLRKVSRLVEAGDLRAVLDSTFPLERVVEAHRRMETGHVHGKVVVTMPGDVARG